MWTKVLSSVAQLNGGQDRGLSSSQQCTGFSVGDGNIEGTLANADLCLWLRERDLCLPKEEEQEVVSEGKGLLGL